MIIKVMRQHSVSPPSGGGEEGDEEEEEEGSHRGTGSAGCCGGWWLLSGGWCCDTSRRKVVARDVLEWVGRSLALRGALLRDREHRGRLLQARIEPQGVGEMTLCLHEIDRRLRVKALHQVQGTGNEVRLGITRCE